MKKYIIQLFTLYLILHTSYLTNAQVAINTDNSNPDASAMLDIKSTTQGVLIPRMTTAERSLISAVAGLMVYDTDLKSLVYFDGTAWMSFRSAIVDKDGDTGIYVEYTSDEDKIKLVANDTVSLTFERTDSDEGRMILQSNRNNTLIGTNSASFPKNIFESILIGDNTGNGAKRIEKSILLGYKAGYQTKSIKNVMIGREAGSRSTDNVVELTENVFIGPYAGYGLENSHYNVAIGSNAMSNSSTTPIATADTNISIGYLAGNRLRTGNSNILVGGYAGYYLRGGSRNIMVGHLAGRSSDSEINENILLGYDSGRNIEKHYNIGIGRSTLRNSKGNYNVAIGTEAGYYHENGNKNVFIGYKAGVPFGSIHKNRSDLLFIDTEQRDNPLIFGSFSGDTVKINGSLYIGTNYQFPTADGTSGQVIKTNGSKTLSWTTGYAGISLTNDVVSIAQHSIDLSGYRQTLSLANDIITISGGGQRDISTYNKTLSISYDNLIMSNGSSVHISTDDDLGNHTATQNIKLNGHSIVHSSGDVISIGNDGKVGFKGTESTSSHSIQGILRVNGSVSRSTSSHGKLTKSGGGTGSSQNRDVSILASNNIVASIFFAISDARVKNIQGISNGKEDLETLNQIDIVDYYMKDTIASGTQAQKKVIAQQVKKVLPQVVDTILTEAIPNIMQIATLQDNWIVFDEKSVIKSDELKAGDIIKIMLENDEAWAEVEAVKDNTFKIKADNQSPITNHLPIAIGTPVTVFIYGTQVKDFHTVDYDGLSMLNLSATQELYRQGVALEKQNQALQERAKQLQQQLEKIERLESLLSELED